MKIDPRSVRILAAYRLAEGNENVVVIVPDRDWSISTRVSDVRTFIRYSNEPSSMMSLQVNRIIIVAPEECDMDNVEMGIRHMLAPHGKVFEV